jgi:capsular polysaccharide transport system permease protein
LLLRKLESTTRVERIRRAAGRIDRLFLLVVAVPTALAVLYFGFLASDVYVSETQFVVRSPDKPRTTGLGALLDSAGFSTAGEEIFAAHEYVHSRDALRALNRDGAVERAYGRDEISIVDRFDPFGWNGSFEDLFDFYVAKVGIEYAPTSSITTMTVRAFTPEEAHKFNRQLLELSEQLINRLNTRGRADLVRFAVQEVQEAEEQARVAALELARFRNARGIIDPERQATVQLQMVSKLQDELIGARMQLLQLRAMAPENPQIPILQVRIQGLAREIDEQLGRVAGDRRSLSATAAQYQRLQLEREFADRRLAAAMNSLEEARNEARRKQAYVERIVQPSIPDEAQEPRRLRGIIATFMLALVAWAILKMLLAGVREHHG